MRYSKRGFFTLSVLVMLALVGIKFTGLENRSDNNDVSNSPIEPLNPVESEVRSRSQVVSTTIERSETPSTSQRKEINIGNQLAAFEVQVPEMIALSYDFPSSAEQMLKELEPLSYNDAIAARTLGTQLRMCKRGPKTKAELNKEIASIENESRLVGEGGVDDDYAVDYLAAAKEAKESYEYCSSLSQDQIERAEEFFKLGSEAGDFLATAALYEQYLFEGDWEPLFEVSQRMWEEHGNATALGALVQIYDQELLNNIQIGTTPNRVTAHALNIVSLEVHFLGFGQFYQAETGSSSNFRVEIDSLLANTAEKLSPQEHLEAEEIAIKLISENQNCCTLF